MYIMYISPLFASSFNYSMKQVKIYIHRIFQSTVTVQIQFSDLSHVKASLSIEELISKVYKV
jgi:hypothetical protein